MSYGEIDPTIRRIVNDLGGRMMRGEDPQVFDSESDLQAFLVAQLGETALGSDWVVVDREVVCEGVGRIDILLKHQCQPRYIVVELKNHDRAEEALFQVLKYLGWVRSRLLKPGETASGLIICTGASEAMRYALTPLQNTIGCLTYSLDLSLTVVEPE